ncbi:MAG: SUMF1/EgtB/PvdO family nonheme iron enzyme, partial [Anaerolineales bacterium]
AGAAPVHAFSPGVSPSGAYNMAGNVAEMVTDLYHSTYYTTLPAEVWNPTGPSQSEFGNYCVVRGGSYYSAVDQVRTGARTFISMDAGSGDVGFRCAHNP